MTDPIGSTPVFSERFPLDFDSGNDACVVWDGSQWVMFHGVPGGPGMYRRTSSAMTGTWSSATQINVAYGKPFILMDLDGAPVVVGGYYWLYCIAGDSIRLFHASSLTGSWTDDGNILGPNPDTGGVTPDGYQIIAVTAYYVSGTVYLYYMGFPGINGSDTDPDATYGYASRVCLATSDDTDDPTGATWTRVGAILNPSTTSTDWDYGWLGGFQVGNRPGGGYWAAYNAGDTRPVNNGEEPDVGAFGVAHSSSLSSGWTKDGVIAEVTDGPTGSNVSTNLWRVFIAADGSTNYWWYNSGPFGTETISYMRDPDIAYWDYLINDDFDRANGSVGNGWTDVGSKYAITSNNLTAATTGSGTHMLLRDEVADENVRVIITVPSFGSDHVYLCVARVAGSTAGNETCYAAAMSAYDTSHLNLKKIESGTETPLASPSLANALTGGKSYTLEFATRGSSPTLLCVSIYNNTDSRYEIHNYQLEDSTSALQAVNPAGVGLYNGSGTATFSAASVEEPAPESTSYYRFALLGVG